MTYMSDDQYNDEISPPLGEAISLQYLAGLIDGEGCLDFMSGGLSLDSKYKYPQIRVALQESDNHVLHMVKDTFGGRINHRKRQKSWRPNCHEQDLWTISGKDCFFLLKKLLPYLVIKQENARFLLSHGKKY